MATPPTNTPKTYGYATELHDRRTLRDYYVIVREHLWLALSVALLVSISFVYFQAKQPPRYAATAVLQFQRPEKVVTTEAVTDTSIRGTLDLNTHFQILAGARIRANVAESFSPQEISLLQKPYMPGLPAGGTPPPAGAIIGDTDFDAIRDSLLVSIRAYALSPEAATLIANRYAEVFMDTQARNAGERNSGAVEFLQRRSEELRKEYETAETALHAYRQRENLVSLDDSLNIVNDRLKSISAALTNARIERLDLEAFNRQVDQFRSEKRDFLEIAFFANHGPIPGLRTKLDELLRAQIVLDQRYLARHPRMIELKNQIASLRQQLTEAAELAAADLVTRLQKATDTENTLTRELQAAEQGALRLGKLSVEFKSLENQALVKRNNYIAILDRLNQTTTTRTLENLPVRIAERATLPYEAATPNLRRIATNGTLLFFAILIGLPLCLNFIDDRIKSSWDVEAFLSSQLLGIIPDLSRFPIGERNLLSRREETTPEVEAFLAIYGTVKIQSRLDFPKTLMLTSTIPGEGKTLVSSNLAGVFARHGKNVLLVDCDLRRPMLHRGFELQNDKGIIPWAEAGFATGEDPLADQNLGIINIAPKLSILRSGGRSKSPTAILENPAFADLLESLKRRFDLVIIDTPPLGAVGDALLIAERTDESIYVCRFNKAQKKHIRACIKNLRESRNELLGVALNGMNPRNIEHYSDYRYYRSYKKYYGAQS